MTSIIPLLTVIFLLASHVSSNASTDIHISRRATKHKPNGRWIATWASMPQLTEPGNLPPAPYTTSTGVFLNTTIRQTIHITAPSTYIRLRLSNAFGSTDLPISSITIAVTSNSTAGSSVIDTTTLKKLTFSGTPAYTIPKGALVVSDEVKLDNEAKAGTELTVSVYLANGQAGNDITSHPGSRTTSWMAFGDHTTAENITDVSTQNVAHWYFISTLESFLPESYRTFVIIGDSITDGRGSTTNGNNRWPDLLLSRLRTTVATSNIALGNLAAGGNRILADGLGPSVLARFDRDVISQPGVAYAMVFEGVNDIGVAASTVAAQQAIGDALIAAYKQLVVRSHAAGIPIFGATITPFCAPGFITPIQSYSTVEREATRQRVNAWIRQNGSFDAVIDFDAAVRNPDAVSQLKKEYDSGDYLHLSVAGYQAMAQAFPVGLFAEWKGGAYGS